MVTLKKYNIQGEQVGEVALEKEFSEVEAHPQMIKDYIVALRANRRQWSASTKGRSEVKHTTKKPHPQKGTGGARQGSLVTAQYRGGGIVFGPKPKFDQHVRINKKERRLAIRYLFVQKALENRIIVLEDKAMQSMQEPKTKTVACFLDKCGFAGRKILFVGPEEASHAASQEVFKLSVRNLPGALYTMAPRVSGYDLVASRYLVLSESALQELQKM